MKSVVATLLLVTSIATATTPFASADEWPNRHVRVIVVGGAGGTGDVLARRHQSIDHPLLRLKYAMSAQFAATSEYPA
jgi:tripartite-type tricarboxylate transporter receptor subunit TctC